MTFVDAWPHPCHPLIWAADGTATPDLGVTLEVFQLRNGDQARIADWAGVQGYPGADGGVLLTDDGQVIGHVGLGAYAVRHDAESLSIVAAESFAAQYTPAAIDTA